MSHINKKYISLLVLVPCFFLIAWLSQSQSLGSFQFRNIEFFGVNDSATHEGTPHKSGPVLVKKITQPVRLNSLQLSFEFSNQEPTFSYGNLFQTGDSLNALRMELQPSSNLVLVLGDGKLFNLSKSLQVGKYYGVSLKYERGKFLKVYIDQAEVLNIKDKGILDGKFDISDIVVGTGLAKQRTLLGTVRNFNLDGAYSYYGRAANLSRWLLIFLCGTLFLVAIRNRTAADAVSSGNRISISEIVDSIAIYGLPLVFIALALLLIIHFGEHHLGLAKWIALLVLPVALVATLLIKRMRNIWKWSRWIFGLAFLVYCVYVAVNAEHKKEVYNAFILSMAAFSFLAFALTLTRRKSPSLLSTQGGIFGNSVAIAFAGLFISVSWGSLVDLTNWSEFMQTLNNHFGVVAAGYFIILGAVFAILFPTISNSTLKKGNQRLCGKLSCIKFRGVLDFIFIAIFFWISFRHDSLFLPGSEYHWEYYVGVVQGITNGGWLLWDTPSQYGFFNILLASLFPSASPWQSFYMFQGTLLFVVATSIYFAARRYTESTVINQLGTFAIVFMSLFFADPGLIGPYPFPSSSVVRFFCVYLLVLTVWYIPKPSLRQAIAISIAWSLSVMWSAESAIYGTAIYLFIMVALIQIRHASFSSRWVLVGTYASIALANLALVFAALYAFYLLRLGVAPDLFGFYEYAVGYAEGFGYVPFPLDGPGNLLLLVFLGISLLCLIEIFTERDSSESHVAPFAAMAGCIWGISTYYIGRPVPQNITAMLPIIAMTVYLSIILARRANIGWYALPIKTTALPLFILILVPLVTPQWWENLSSLKSFSPDVTSSLPKASDDLQKMLASADPSADTAVVYYGDEAAPPVLSGQYAKFNDRNWLPIPLQLFEEPVSKERRSIYIARYLCRIQPEKGILVVRKGDVSTRLPGFLNELHKFYDFQDVLPGDSYVIYRFYGIDLQHCPSSVVIKNRS